MELVCREGQQVDVLFLNINWQVLGRLHSIGMEQDDPLTSNTSNLLNGLDRTDLIVGIHHGDKAGVRADGRFNLLRQYNSVFMDIQQRDFKALFFKSGQRVQYCMVLKGY